LKKIRKRNEEVHQNNYYYLCSRTKEFLLKKHPWDLMNYFPLIIFFIEDNYNSEVLEILKNLKKHILDNGLDENQFLIAGANYLYLIKRVIILYHQRSDFALKEITKILEDMCAVKDSYLRDEAMTVLRLLKVLPNDRYLEFMKPSISNLDKVLFYFEIFIGRGYLC
jgi:hypothetical protein